MGVPERTAQDQFWTSEGLELSAALRSWRQLASEALPQMNINVHDKAAFSARWGSRCLGPLRFVTVEAPSQSIRHLLEEQVRGSEPVFQLVHFQHNPAPVTAAVGSKGLKLGEGEFVLVDNAQPYQMDMGGNHRAVILVMPGDWIERCLPDPVRSVGEAFSAASLWGLPLGSYLRAMAEQFDHAQLPRSVLADQLGALLPLAVGQRPAATTRHKTKLARRAIHAIQERYSDPDITPECIARELGISKRYLHALLAEAQTTFLVVLGRARLERASELLIDPRFRREQIAEVAWRCGYRDPGYFAHVFRRRFGKGPREWRYAHT